MTDARPTGQITVRFTGREAPKDTRAGLFIGATRAAAQPQSGQKNVPPEDHFFPKGYIESSATYDVTPAARSGGGAQIKQRETDKDELVVLELADGSTLITSGEKLYDSLRDARPDLVDGNEVLLDKLSTELTTFRGGFSGVVKGFISTVTFLKLAAGIDDDIVASAGQLLEKAIGKVPGVEDWATRVGTTILVQAIEKKAYALGQGALEPGVYRWRDAGGKAGELQLEDKVRLGPNDAPDSPILIFIHGTGSSTRGSFGYLFQDNSELWTSLGKFGKRIYGFEHPTLSCSPIENAIALLEALPENAHISLVSHSRGGLVADLVCLDDFDALIDSYQYRFPGGKRREELDQAYAEQREHLKKLATLLHTRKPVIERYLRVASPANGTLLASGNLDVFLSSLLTLLGNVPFFFSNPLYWAFKRLVLEIVSRRSDPHYVPGIEAMLPDSPLAQLLRDAPVQEGLEMAVIAGDVEGGNMLKRLGVMLTDLLVFDKEENDLVVNTPAMLAGIAPQANARMMFDRGAHVSHFRYFKNADTRAALREWLISKDVSALTSFHPLTTVDEIGKQPSIARDAAAPGDQPVVVVLPDVMASHLDSGKERVWFDPKSITVDGLKNIEWKPEGKKHIEARRVFEVSYSKLCASLATSHRVECFAYDWRQPLEVLGERLGQFLDQQLQLTKEPVRLLAHGMGGLVVRACIRKRSAVMDALMERSGARLIMLGTPNHGTHAAVEHLLGKGEALRTLWRLAPTGAGPEMDRLVEVFAEFPGLLQMLPRPGFLDTFQGQRDGGLVYDYQNPQTWKRLQQYTYDLWFEHIHCGIPSAQSLKAGSWLWDEGGDGPKEDSLPEAYEKKTVYVFGMARNTPCGIRPEGNGGNRLKMVGTASGDGVVTWASGRLRGIGSYYYMPVQHGDLAAAAAYFNALTELLTSGATTQLNSQAVDGPPVEQARPVLYNPGPPTTTNAEAVQRCLVGGSLRSRVPTRSQRRLNVDVKAMDLRFLTEPILVGHYEQDPISGAEALIDRELLAGDLSKRYSLGQYAGQRGSATVVLRTPSEEFRRCVLAGAVVTGLGPYDGSLSATALTEAVTVGALRYLLHVADVLGKEERELPLASLLIGYSSAANLSVSASVEALVRGVIQANWRFYDTTGLKIRIARLDIVELYLDTAITAVYELRKLRERLFEQARTLNTTLIPCSELLTGEGVRQRLLDSSASSYWPRLIVTDAARGPDGAGPSRPRAAPDGVAAAERLRFMYVGNRARAVTVVQQRQPELIEGLVREQIRNSRWSDIFGRMLFQLMVPHDFKDAARQLDRVVLVVDDYTANLPWELMLADGGPAGTGPDQEGLPLALRAPVVRQLTSSAYRGQVAPAVRRKALVIGNPSTRGFATAFPELRGGQRAQDPPNLGGAASEAAAIADVLEQHSYKVVRLIGPEDVVAATAAIASRRVDGGPGQPPPDGPANPVTASRVLEALYSEPWRILHIAAHGIFDEVHRNGGCRSGVLLSDGLLITAAEIAAMEIVPELVFLNCCHSGQIDAGLSSNKLAASVARELIDIGVRCVIAAGWAINDAQAKCFGNCFYKELLGSRKQFGEAVFEARKAAWRVDRTDITWGAFQAYGDPGWMAEPLPESAREPAEQEPYVSVEEFLDDLADTRVRLAHQNEAMSPLDQGAMANRVAKLRSRCPPNWADLPQMHSALGMTWRELNRTVDAYFEFLASVQSQDQLGQVPVHDIEQLADVEATLGEQCAARGLVRAQGEQEQGGRDQFELALALLEQAEKRIKVLESLTKAAAIGAEKLDELQLVPENERLDRRPLQAARTNYMRMALLGNIHKRKASVKALQLTAPTAQGDGRQQPAKAAKLRQQLNACLQDAIKTFKQAEGTPGNDFAPELVLERLALETLTGLQDTASQDAAAALAGYCGRSTDSVVPDMSGATLALRRPRALLVENLIKQTLGTDSDASRAKLEAIAQSYRYVTTNITLKPNQLAEVVNGLDTLSRFWDALAEGAHAASRKRTAEYLKELARRLQPAGKTGQQTGAKSGGV